MHVTPSNAITIIDIQTVYVRAGYDVDCNNVPT